MQLKINIKYLLLMLAITFSVNGAWAQMRIQGNVTDVNGKPLNKCYIVDNGYTVGETDLDGNFSASVKPGAKLMLFCVGYNDKSVDIGNNQIFNIQLTEREQVIDAVSVTAKKTKKRIVVEPTDIELIGNYFHIRPKITLPKRIFTDYKRLIVQPTLYNATTKERKLLRPLVIDGRIYGISQDRMFNYDMTKDALYDYIIEDEPLSQGAHLIYPYHDSIQVPVHELDHDYRSDCYIELIGFSPKAQKYNDSIVIAKGTKNSFRFFDYGDFNPRTLKGAQYEPKPEMQLMADKGSSNIKFRVGRAEIDNKDPQNAIELEKIYGRIQEIVNDEFSSLKGISIVGSSSPEGSFALNSRLADARTKVVLDRIQSSLTEEQLKFTNLEYTSNVAPWSKIIPLLERDGEHETAEKIKEVVAKYDDNIAQCGYAIIRMPEYRKIIKDTYLPQLRRVDYTLDFSVFRNYTDAEIREMFVDNNGKIDVKEKISRYEMYRLIESSKGEAEKDYFEKKALEKYPNFMLIANRQAVKILKNDLPVDIDLLKDVDGVEAPFEVNWNQVLMCLKGHEIELAASVDDHIEANDETSHLKAIVNTLLGEYELAYPVIVSKGGFNSVLLKMAMERYTEAFGDIKLLLEKPENSSNAKMWYMRAICADKTDDILDAMNSMTQALALDPSLEEIGRLDSDAADIIELVKPTNQNNDVQ